MIINWNQNIPFMNITGSVKVTKNQNNFPLSWFEIFYAYLLVSNSKDFCFLSLNSKRLKDLSILQCFSKLGKAKI